MVPDTHAFGGLMLAKVQMNGAKMEVYLSIELRWIACEEEMPEKEKTVVFRAQFATQDEGIVETRTYLGYWDTSPDGEIFWTCDRYDFKKNDVTHWHPIPE